MIKAIDYFDNYIKIGIYYFQIFSICWSQCGNKLASISKDGSIRIYEPLISDIPVLEVKCGPGSGSKAARIEWVLNDTCILVSGFGK